MKHLYDNKNFQFILTKPVFNIFRVTNYTYNTLLKDIFNIYIYGLHVWINCEIAVY